MTSKKWNKTKLGNVIILEYGSGLPQTNRTGDGFPVFGSSGIIGHHKNNIVNGPGIVIGRKGTVGSILWSESGFWPIDTTYFVIPKISLHFRWLFWCLKVLPLKNLDSSTGIPGLNRNDIYECEIESPPLPEQKRIADILDTVDETICQTEILLAKLKQIKAGLLHDLLTYGLDESGQIRDPIAHPEQFKDSSLGRIPNEWQLLSLRSLYKTPIRDFGSFSMTNLITFLNEGVPFLKSEIIEEEHLNLENITYISIDVHNLLKKSWVYPGNILYSKIGSALGKAILYDGKLGICNSNAAIAKIDINESVALSSYMVVLLNAPEIKQRIMKSIISLLPRLNLTDISNFIVPIPAISEQSKIIEVLHQARQRIVTEEKYLSKLKLQKYGLMEDLLAGRVRVRVAEEVAK